MDAIRRDVRQAVRSLRREPAFTALAAFTLMLGVGATSAVFSVVDAVLLRPLPYAQPERLVSVWGREAATDIQRAWSSWPDFRDYQAQARTALEGLAAWRRLPVTVTAPGQEPARLVAGAASRELFGLLGTPPVLGRSFLPAEDEPGGPLAVVLSHHLWQERFGGSAQALGATLLVDGRPHTVVGVLPARFDLLREASLWVAVGSLPRITSRGMHGLRLVGRLREGHDVAAASAELAATASRLAEAYPGDNAGRTAWAEPLQEWMVAEARPTLLLLLGAAGLVLLISCANLAGLLLARGLRRQRELAVRTSLGATRGALARQLLGETLVLSLLGGALGLALAAAGVPALLALAPDDLPRAAEVAVDQRVAAFTLATALLTTLLFGVGPAFASARTGPATRLRAESGRTAGGPGRTRQWLTVAQTALTVVLLVGSGLLLRSLHQLARVDPGFDATHVLTAELQLPDVRYKDPQRAAAFYRDLLERLRALPGVEAAAAAEGHPFAPSWGTTFAIEGRPPFPAGQEPEPIMRVVTPGYFEATGVKLLQGRVLDERDAAGAPGAVLVNAAMAAKFFPGQDPVGQRLLRRSWWPGYPEAWQIVGVVADVRTGSLDGAPADAIYYPHAQVPMGNLTLLLRTARDPLALAGSLQAAVRALDRELPLARVRTLEQAVAESLGPRRFQATLVLAFGALALLLAAVGLYGVLAYAVAARTREIGVRRALGAVAGDVTAMVARQAARLVGAGLLLGVPAALVLARTLTSFLYGVRPADPTTLAAAAGTLALAALLASLVPLRRALAVSPAEALRAE